MTRPRGVFWWVGRAIWLVFALVYFVLTRVALHGAALYLGLYFTLNTELFNAQLCRLLSEVLPGRVFVEQIEIQPTLVDVSLVQAVIEDGLGRPVITVDIAYATLGVGETVTNVLQQIAGSDVLPMLALSRARAVRPDVLVEVEPDAWTGIGTAFYDRSRPKAARSGFRCEIPDAAVVDGRVRVIVSGESPVLVDSAGLDVPLATVVTDRGRVWAEGPLVTARGGRILAGGLELPWAGLSSRVVRWADGQFDIGTGELVVSQTRVRLSGGLNNRGRGVRVDLRAEAEVAGDPILIEQFGASVVGEVRVEAEGPLSFPRLRAELALTRLDAAGFSLGPLETAIELRTDPWRDSVWLEPTAFELDGGPVFVEELVWERAGANDPRDDGAVRVALFAPESSAAGLLALGLDTVPGWAGEATLSGRFARPGWRAPGQPLWRFTGRVEVAGEARRVSPYRRGAGLGVVGDFTGAVVHRAPGATASPEPGGLAALEPSRGLGLSLRVEAPSLVGWLGSNDAALDGRLTSEGLLDVGLEGTVNLKRLGIAFGAPALRGSATVTDAHVVGHWANPSARFGLEGRRVRYGALRVESVGARVRYEDGLLETRELVAATSLGRVTADASLRLLAGDRWHPELPLEVTRGRVENLDLEGVLALFGYKLGLGSAPTATVDVEAVSLPLGAADVLGGLSGRARARAGAIRLLDEVWRGLEFDVAVKKRTLALESGRVSSESGVSVEAKGSWSVPAGRVAKLAGELKLDGLDLKRFGPLRDRGLAGQVDAWLKAGHGESGLGFEGTLNVADFVMNGVDFGSAKLDFSRGAGDRKVTISSPSFFEGFRLDRGTLVVDPSGVPNALSANVGLERLDLSRFGVGRQKGGAPSGKKSRIELATVSKGSVSLALTTGSTPFSASLELPEGAVELILDGVRLTNRGVLSLRTDGRSVELERLIASVGPYAIAACGAYSLDSGRLDLDVAGSLELDDIPGIRRVATGLEGRVVTAGGSFQDSCLLLPLELDGLEALGNPRGFVRVSDAASAPLFTGGLDLEGLVLRPRGLGMDIAVDQGAVRFEASEGVQSLVIDAATPLMGTLEDGTFTLSGRAALPKVPSRNRLEHWLPDTGELRLVGQDLVVASPKEYRVTLDPELALRFANVYRPTEKERQKYGLAPGERDLRLSGKIDIPEGEYFSGFTVISRALGRVLERGARQGPVKDLTATLPFLSELRLDVGVHAASLGIQSDFGVGSTDLDTRLDLTVRGTYASPLLYGNVAVTDGTVSYNVFKREFEVTEGRLEFDGPIARPLLDVRAEANIEVRKQNRLADSEELEDYSVTVTVKGRVPDYQIAFSSKPSLPEIDVQYLILLGRTKQQLADEGASGGSLELVSADLSTLVTSLVEAPFVDELVVEPTLGGGGRVEAVLRLGRGIRIGLVGRQETTGTRSYDARYRHRLLDQLILEASRRSATETTGERDRYEVQLQYTIPLD